MITSKITSKGQTTLPKEIQKLLNVRPGDQLMYLVEADGRVSLLPKNLSIHDLKGVLPKPARAVTIEQMDQSVAEAPNGYNQ